jgi:hypothetical protein
MLNDNIVYMRRYGLSNIHIHSPKYRASELWRSEYVLGPAEKPDDF